MSYNLFSLLEETAAEPVEPKKSSKNILEDLLCTTKLEEIIRKILEYKYETKIDTPYIGLKTWSSEMYIPVIGNDFAMPVGNEPEHYLSFGSIINKVNHIYLIYIDNDGTPYKMDITICFENSSYIRSSYYDPMVTLSNKPVIKHIKIAKPKICTRLFDWANKPATEMYFLLNNEADVWNTLQHTNPYLYEFACEYGVDNPATLFIAPQIEQLVKANFHFAQKLIERYCRKLNHYESKDLECFNRLTQPGKNLKEIFKCSKTLYTVLKDEESLQVWDVYRKMEKQGKFSKDTLIQAYQSNYSEKELNEINTILNKKYNDKPVFTWDTLQNYLGRLDNFQAISRWEAFPLIKDYLMMCQQLEMQPRVDSDSLKREHDIAARTLRQKHDEIMAKKMEGACDYLKVNDYKESVFMIRGIRSYNDLIDEAKQQHNCVAGYANSIIKRQSLIYVMRRTDEPDKSLITVEINPEETEIRQKFLAFNQKIHNKAQTEFLDRWISKVRQRNALGASSIA